MTAALAPYSRLWPVLVALAALIGGSVAVELVADDHRASRVVHIVAGVGPAADDGADADAEGGAGFATTPPVDDGHAEARALARRGEVPAAITRYRDAVVRHPEVAALHAELGFWLLTDHDAAGARPELERAAALDDKDPWIELNLGIALSRDGRAQDAEARYRRALVLRPAFNAAELALGTVLRRQGKLDEALAVLAAAATGGGNQERARALVALGRTQLAAKLRDDAARSIGRAIDLAPADVEIRLAAARAYLASGKKDDHARAVEILRSAAMLAPDVAAVFSALGRANERLGERAAAEVAYGRAVQLDPDYRYARRRLLRLALDRQDYPQARLAADYLLQAAPEEPEHHFLAGLVAARGERPDEARAHYRDAIARAEGDYPEAYFNLGLLEKGAGALDAAIAAYGKAIEQRPSYQQAWNNLGLTYVAAKRTTDAEDAFRKALALDDQYATAWLNLGELLAAGGRDPDAVDAFQHAIAARPGAPEARLALAAVLERTGRAGDALGEYRAIVTTDPRNVAGWYALGAALAAQGDRGAAEDAFGRALAIDPEHLPALRGRAADRAADRDPGAAIAAWSEVVDRAPDDGAARRGLAAARLRAGDRAGCARELTALPAAASDPETVRLRAACPAP